MAPLASPDELRLWLGGLSAAQLSDARATLILEGVSGEVLEYTNRIDLGFALKPADAANKVRVNGSGSSVLLLPDPPVTALTSIVEDPDGDATALVEGANFDWDPDGIVTRVDGARWAKRARWYEVTYARGRELSESVRNVVLRVAARAVPNPEGLTQENEVSYSAGYAFDDTRLPTLAPADKLALYEYRL